MTSRRLSCERLVTADGVVESATVTIDNGAVTAITTHPSDQPSDQPTEWIAGWTLPGFVDTHVHGGGGADYATTDPEEALRAREFHRRFGTTTSFASLVTASIDTLVAQLETLRPLVATGELAGVHLEGPFLSEIRRGAHDPQLLRAPDAATVDRLLTAGQGSIAMVTLAPELPGALDAIERLVAAGVVVAVGHTDADEQTTAGALDAGAGVATHLFNAMPGVHHRRPGPIPRLLFDERATLELICDGFHLHPDVVRLAVAAAGPNRVALVTDAMLAAGAPDGDYVLGSLQVRVIDGRARLVTEDGRPGSIAGSTLTMADAFAFLIREGVAIPDAARMAATTPARRHALAGKGLLAVGAAADLCVVDDQGRLRRVMQAGHWVT